MYLVVLSFHNEKMMDCDFEVESFDDALALCSKYAAPDVAVGIFEPNNSYPIWQQPNAQGLDVGLISGWNPS